jgi:hypothetical protein
VIDLGAALDSPEEPRVFFVRLDVTPRPGGTDAVAYGSHDGVSWKPLGGTRIDARLALQGIAASSHGTGAMRFVFGALRRDARRISSRDLRPTRIGDCAAGAVSDG